MIEEGYAVLWNVDVPEKLIISKYTHITTYIKYFSNKWFIYIKVILHTEKDRKRERDGSKERKVAYTDLRFINQFLIL